MKKQIKFCWKEKLFVKFDVYGHPEKWRTKTMRINVMDTFYIVSKTSSNSS